MKFLFSRRVLFYIMLFHHNTHQIAWNDVFMLDVNLVWFSFALCFIRPDAHTPASHFLQCLSSVPRCRGSCSRGYASKTYLVPESRFTATYVLVTKLVEIFAHLTAKIRGVSKTKMCLMNEREFARFEFFGVGWGGVCGVCGWVAGYIAIASSTRKVYCIAWSCLSALTPINTRWLFSQENKLH